MRVTLKGLNHSLQGTGYSLVKLASTPIYSLNKQAYIPGVKIQHAFQHENNPELYMLTHKIYQPLTQATEDYALVRLIDTNQCIQTLSKARCTDSLEIISGGVFYCKQNLLKKFVDGVLSTWDESPHSLDYCFAQDVQYMFNYHCNRVFSFEEKIQLDIRHNQPHSQAAVLGGTTQKPVPGSMVLGSKHR